MKINFNINTKLNKELTIDQLKMVLFKSMLKLQELATINCPVDKGRLRNSLFLSPSAPGFSNYQFSDGVDYGVDVEFGTSPHVILPKGKALKFKVGGKTIFAKRINHPGTNAQPFFRPALDQVKSVWVDRYFEQVLKKDNNI